jgi:pimeloyl-ACP methyl ester carboxylesterase
MATYVLIPGAGSDSWYWYLVTPRLTALGHDVVAPDLPCEDDDAGIEEYANVVVEAIGSREDLILVAQSMGSFTAGLVAARLPVHLVVLVAAMMPKEGESPGEWGDATGSSEARREADERAGRPVDGEFDVFATFLHDVPEDVVRESAAHVHGQSGTPFERKLPMPAWPDVPTRFLLCRHDRFFPAEFQRRVVRERLGITPDEMDGGHLPALHSPEDLVRRLESYRVGTGGTAVGTGATAVGTGATAVGTGGTAVGTGATAVGTGGTAVGTGATAVGTGGTAVGTGRTAIGAGPYDGVFPPTPVGRALDRSPAEATPLTATAATAVPLTAATCSRRTRLPCRSAT